MRNNFRKKKPFHFQWHFLAGIWCQNNVVSKSMRRDGIGFDTTSFLSHVPAGLYIGILSGEATKQFSLLPALSMAVKTKEFAPEGAFFLL